jgi:hypothetical protein
MECKPAVGTPQLHPTRSANSRSLEAHRKAILKNGRSQSSHAPRSAPCSAAIEASPWTHDGAHCRTHPIERPLPGCGLPGCGLPERPLPGCGLPGCGLPGCGGLPLRLPYPPSSSPKAECAGTWRVTINKNPGGGSLLTSPRDGCFGVVGGAARRFSMNLSRGCACGRWLGVRRWRGGLRSRRLDRGP